jgi:LacI family transcriptional regulator
MTEDSLPSIVSFDNFELAEMMPVPVTVVDHDARELGRQAARMLFERLTGARNASVVRRIEMATHIWVARS